MGIKLGLSNVRMLLGFLGDPQERFGAVHVAGSNGKGSVSSMTASILRSAGHRTGLYTSPHLVNFTERITVDGKEIPEVRLLKLISEVRQLTEDGPFPRPLTFFEITTAMAFLHFAESKVDEAVIEVGMGGRLDATNVIKPRCCVLTPISLEHTGFLGDTIAKIAYEKASIIKEGVPTVSSPQVPQALQIIEWMARCRSSPLKVLGRDFHGECLHRDMDGTMVHLPSLGNVRLGMLGKYQCQNAAVAAQCALELRRQIEMPIESIIKGLERVRWPGRLEVVGKEPLTVLDVTHTPEGARTIASELDMFPGSPRVLVVGMLRDKDAKGVMSALAPHFDQVICTSAVTPRAFSPKEMMDACSGLSSHRHAVAGVGPAINKARQMTGATGFIMICGSLYTVGEAMQFLGAERGP
jgi:dihydrofolate synthase/folylpolyglutamate synthase